MNRFVCAVFVLVCGSALGASPVTVTGPNGNQQTVTGGAALVSSSPLAVTPIDRGGTITTGGTPQNAMESNSARNGGHCENPTSATEPLYVAVVGAATVGGAGNFCDLAPGGSCTLAPTGQTIIRTAVSVNATTTGHRFLCTEEQ